MRRKEQQRGIEVRRKHEDDGSPQSHEGVARYEQRQRNGGLECRWVLGNRRRIRADGVAYSTN